MTYKDFRNEVNQNQKGCLVDLEPTIASCQFRLSTRSFRFCGVASRNLLDEIAIRQEIDDKVNRNKEGHHVLQSSTGVLGFVTNRTVS